MRKGLIIVGGLVVVGVLLVGGGVVVATTPAGEQLRAKFKKTEEAKIVRIEPAYRSTITRTVSAPGMVEPRTKVEISAQVSARITALPFEEGEEVKAGDVVVRLDAEDLTARLEAAKARQKAQEARQRGSEADLAVALSDFGRKRELHDTGDISDSVYEQAENRYNQAVSAVEMAKADVEIARAQIIEAERDLANAIISSPIDGVITTLNAEVGELVVVGTLNNAGSIILEIADLSDMLLMARIDESNVAQVEAAQEATVFVNAYRNDPFRGVVERVGLERKRWEDGTYYYEAEVKLSDEAGRPLLSGLSATAEIDVQKLSDVLVVPSQAVLDRRVDELPRDTIDRAAGIVDKRKTFATVVYTITDNKAVADPVSIGPSDLAETVILAGIEDGQRVITGPFKTLVEMKDEDLVKDEAEKKAEDEAAGAEQAQAGAEGETTDAPDPGS
ncbi:MAG: efflux RND transporter periplasmic adaptor subunit [Phycisphaerales bacterium]|nr:efflux RND transporter periplasmic adaptor subunit [Phycisphaerales bacterium]